MRAAKVLAVLAIAGLALVAFGAVAVAEKPFKYLFDLPIEAWLLRPIRVMAAAQ